MNFTSYIYDPTPRLPHGSGAWVFAWVCTDCRAWAPVSRGENSIVHKGVMCGVPRAMAEYGPRDVDADGRYAPEITGGDRG